MESGMHFDFSVIAAWGSELLADEPHFQSGFLFRKLPARSGQCSEINARFVIQA
jgi:hypothetical protein